MARPITSQSSCSHNSCIACHMCHTAELSGSSAHVHMDEGIDVLGLEDVELMEPGEIGSAELRHFNI